MMPTKHSIHHIQSGLKLDLWWHARTCRVRRYPIPPHSTSRPGSYKSVFPMSPSVSSSPWSFSNVSVLKRRLPRSYETMTDWYSRGATPGWKRLDLTSVTLSGWPTILEPAQNRCPWIRIRLPLPCSVGFTLYVLMSVYLLVLES